MGPALDSIHNEKELLAFLDMDVQDRGGRTIPSALFILLGTHGEFRQPRTNADPEDPLEDRFVRELFEIDYEGNHINFEKRRLLPVCAQ
jgi:hypothetical protein